MSSSLINEKKVSELLEKEKRLYNEIEQLKQERDEKMREGMENVDKERECWKGKMGELEERVREQEKKHSQLIFFHEKERAKWNLEKDHLSQQKFDLQDQVQRLEKKKELLLRENEKIKNQSKSQRKYGGANQTYVGGLNSSFVNTSNKKLPLQPQNKVTRPIPHSVVRPVQRVQLVLRRDQIAGGRAAGEGERSVRRRSV